MYRTVKDMWVVRDRMGYQCLMMIRTSFAMKTKSEMMEMATLKSVRLKESRNVSQKKTIDSCGCQIEWPVTHVCDQTKGVVGTGR